MALIYTKSAEKTLILSPREFLKRQIDFDDWTEMRLGIYFSGVTSSNDNTQASSEVVALSTAADRLAFGLKNYSTDDLPGEAGSTFVGCSNQTGQKSECNGVGFFSNGPSAVVACALNGSSLVDGGDAADTLGNYMMFPANITGASGYCGFFGLKFVINNRGLSTQSINLSVGGTQTVSGSDYSPSALRTAMNNATYGTAKTVAWNDGGAAYDIPDAVYVRMPFYNNRIRISCIRALRYA